MKKTIAFLCCIFLLLLIGGCRKEQTADRTGSFGNINQLLVRGEDWRQIVVDSPFQLGEVYESERDDDGTIRYQIPFGTYPNIDGSTVSVPMGMEFARQHLGVDDEDAASLCRFSTTHNAYEYLIDKKYRNHNGASTNGRLFQLNATLEPAHPVDIIIVTPPSREELDLAASKDVELIIAPVCYDAFVFITHIDNPIESLTAQQIRDIYAGKITNWQQVGAADVEIRAFQREPNSGSQTAMESLVMQGTPMLPPEVINLAESMGGLIESVAEYENKSANIGYTYRFYLDNLYRDDRIKTIAVDGVAPSDAHIRDGSYPFTTTYNAVIRGADKENTGGLFMEWILSKEGQTCIEQAGYIPLSPIK